MKTLIRASNAFLALSISGLLTSCSVVPKQHAKLTGITDLAVWRDGLAAAKDAGASQVAYDQARGRINSLVSPKLELEVDRVAGQSLFGLGGAVDLSKEKIIDAETATAVQNFFDSKNGFGSGDLATAAAIAVIKWAETAAREARQSSATNLKQRLNSYKWPAWKDVK